MSSHTALLDIGASIADGSDVNWAEVASDLDGDDRELLEQLRVVAEIAALHRSVVGDDSLRERNRGRVVGRIAPPSRSALALNLTSESEDAPAHAPGHALPESRAWGRYDLLDLVGEGAFGEVYRAVDVMLQREVALKLYRTRDDADTTTARMVAEGRTLAQVRHPNVVAVFGAETHAGVSGLCMEYIKGLTLERIVTAQGPFSAREAAAVGQDVARALAAVHAAGLVHRDVKARNVMREEGGRTVLMDFGTGQTRRDPDAQAASLTGTPLCLAPEILEGREASVRSDVYSLGVLLFYLVTGRYPVAATSLEELRRAHAARRADRLRDLRPTLSESFVRVVERAIDPDPLLRFESAGSLQAALSAVLDEGSPGVAVAPQPATRSRWNARAWIAGGVATVTLVFGAGWWLMRPPVVVVDPVRSLAIVPFVNRGETGDFDYIGVGLADFLNARLAKASDLELRHAPRGAKGARLADDPIAAGRVIGVDALLTGGYRVADGRIQVDYALMDVRRNLRLAGGTLPLALDELSRVEDVIRGDLARVVPLEGTSPENTRPVPQASQSRAFQSLLRSHFELDRFWQQPSDSQLALAERHVLLALDDDPRSALALVSLAKLRWIAAFFGYGDGEATLSRAEASARRALEIDAGDAEAHAAMALVQFQRGELDAMRESLRQALRASPHSGFALYAAGFYFLARGLADNGVVAFERARSIDPSLVRREVGFAHRYRGDFAKAAEEFRQVLAEHPTDLTTAKSLAAVLTFLGRWDDAAAVVRTLTDRIPDDPGAQLQATLLETARGNGAGIAALTRRFGDRYWADPGFAANVASLYAIARQPVETVRWLERAIALGMRNYPYVMSQPAIVALGTDPAMAGVLRALQSEWEQATARERREPLLADLGQP